VHGAVHEREPREDDTEDKAATVILLALIPFGV
jgi:hypothetical protein